MANNFDVKGISVISPKGELEWCKYVEPDTKYNADGEFSVNLLLDPEEAGAKEFISKLENLRDTALGQLKENLGAKGNQWSAQDITATHYDKDGNETGKVIVKCKLKDIAKRKAMGKPCKIQASGPNKEDLVAKKTLVGNGSIGIVGCFAFAYEMASTKKVGVSLQWQKLRVFDLVSYANDEDDLFGVETSQEDVFETTAEEQDDLDF
jgi:hypothetical protein